MSWTPSAAVHSPHSPLGIILVSKDDSAERILFMYPFDPDMPSPGKCLDSDESKTTSVPCKDEPSTQGELEDRYCEAKFGMPVKMLAPLLCSKGTDNNGAPFEIKVDNIRFAGYPWNVEGCVHSLAVVFVLPGNAEAEVVDAFQRLSKKIAIAIDSEQQRCNYLKDQIQIMQPAHDEFEVLSDEQKRDNHCPYAAILEKSGLAKHLRDIFEEVMLYGMVDVFVDDCIEVGFCVEPKAMCQAGLTPKSSVQAERIMQRVCPYHGLLFLEDTLPSPDSNPFVLRFLEEYEPSRSIDEMSLWSGLPIRSVLQIVKHYLLWARAIVVYPICTSNVYANALSNAPFTTIEMAFAQQFSDDGPSLAKVLDAFSRPATLDSFLTDNSLYSNTTVRMEMLVFLLRNQLLIQLHTFLYLLPPPSGQKILNFDQSQLSARIRTAVNTSSMGNELKNAVLNVCGQALSSGTSEPEIFGLVSFVPYLSGRNHVEDIMYRTGLNRTMVTKVLDTFSELICPFYCEDLISEE